MVSADAMYHVKRKQAMLKEDPKTAEFEGPFRPSMLLIALLVGVQWGLWYFVQNHVTNYFIMCVFCTLGMELGSCACVRWGVRAQGGG